MHSIGNKYCFELSEFELSRSNCNMVLDSDIRNASKVVFLNKMTGPEAHYHYVVTF